MSDISRRRPWLAVLLALMISGLGHAYLRRWARAFGWYVAITATVVLLVPDTAIEGMFAGDPPPIGEIAPVVVVVAASVVDAYVVAVRNNREYERRVEAATAMDGQSVTRPEDTPEGVRDDAGDASSESSSESTGPTLETDERTVSCPSCGREADPEFDFCQWCAEPLEA